MRKVIRVVPGAIEGFVADRCSQHAAGIAYRVLFSIVPLAIVLVSVFGLVLQDDAFRADVTAAIIDRLPFTDAGGADVERAITAIATPASALGLISIVVFAWAASGMMSAIRLGLETAMRVERGRPAAHAKLVDLALVVAAALLVLLTVVVTLLGRFAQAATVRLAREAGLGGDGVGVLVVRAGSLALSIGVVLMLYRFVPSRRLPFRAALAGAGATTFLFGLITVASGYVLDGVNRLSAVYGSLSAALLFLYSVYLYACALLYGAEFAAAWARPPGPPGPPILVQLRDGVRGLFFAPRDAADNDRDTTQPASDR